MMRINALPAVFMILTSLLAAETFSAERENALTVEQIIDLKGLGYADDAILEEIKKDMNRGQTPQATESELHRMRQAGVSEQIISLLKPSKPAAELAPETVAAWLRQGKTVEFILNALIESGTKLRLKPRELLQFKQAAQPPHALLLALKGESLSVADLQQLASQKTGPAAIELLLKLVGTAEGSLDQPTIGRLIQAGLAPEMARDLSAGRFRRATLTETYVHPLNLFTVSHPANWKMLRAVNGMQVGYAFTPEANATDPEKLSFNFAVMILPIQPGELLHGLPAAKALRQLLPVIRMIEPNMRPDLASLREVVIDGRPAASLTAAGSLRKQPGEFHSRVWLFWGEDNEVVLLAGTAPRAELTAYQPTFQTMAERFHYFGQRSAKPLEPRLSQAELVDRYKQAVVQVENAGHGFGTGFFVREDGYLVTNCHVVATNMDEVMQQGKPVSFGSRYIIHWDESLGLPDLEAEVVDCRFRPAATTDRLNSWAMDIALLKVPPVHQFATIKPTFVPELKLGEAVVALGFPAQKALGGQLALTVTSGALTRFNRNAHGQVYSLWIDAVFTHGSSGGPCISMTTGRVIGQNTFGYDYYHVQTNAVLRDIVNYHGVIPSDYILNYFPLATQVEADRESRLTDLDYYDIAVLCARRGEPEGGARTAEDGVKRYMNSVDLQSLAASLSAVSVKDPQQFAERVGKLEKIARSFPEHQATLEMLSTLNGLRGNAVEALRYAEKLTQLAPDEPAGLLLEADLNVRFKRWEPALAAAKRLQALAGNALPQPYLTEGRALYELGRVEEGKQAYAKALSIHPANLEARMGLARYDELKKDYIGALLKYDALEQELPRAPVVQAAIARCHAARADAKAFAYYVKAINLWHKYNLPADGEMLIEAAAFADKAGSEVQRANFRACYIEQSPNTPQSAKFHADLRDLHQPLAPGLAFAHARFAADLDRGNAQNRDRLSQLEKRAARMGDKDIRTMVRCDYSLPLVLYLISNTPSAFAINSEQDFVQLGRQYNPQIAQAIYEALKKYGPPTRTGNPTGEAPRDPTDPRQPPVQSQWYVGLWQGNIVQNGSTIGQASLRIAPDGRYDSQGQLQGQAPISESGIVAVQNNTMTFTPNNGQPALNFTIVYQSPAGFAISLPNGRGFVMQRLQNPGEAPQAPVAPTQPVTPVSPVQPQWYVGTWQGYIAQGGNMIGQASLKITADGRFDSRCQLQGQTSISESGIVAVQNNTMTFTPNNGQPALNFTIVYQSPAGFAILLPNGRGFVFQRQQE